MARIVFTLLTGLFLTAASYGQDSLAVVVAEKGDGIFSLLRKQGMNPTDHYQDFLVLNKENLREGRHLYEGAAYLLPTTTQDSAETTYWSQTPKRHCLRKKKENAMIFLEKKKAW